MCRTCWAARAVRIQSTTEAYVRLPTSRTGNTPVVATRLCSSGIGDAGRVLGVNSLATRAVQALGLSWAGCVGSTCARLALSFVGSSLCAARRTRDNSVGPQALVARPRHCDNAHSGHEYRCSLRSRRTTHTHNRISMWYCGCDACGIGCCTCTRDVTTWKCTTYTLRHVPHHGTL